MAEWQETSGAVGAVIERTTRAITGRQPYHLEVIGPANGVELSVVSFEAIERMGEPYRITIELTHPDELARGDYLGRSANFSIDSADGSEPRKFCGCITGFSQTKSTADFHAYRFVVEAHIARLRLTQASRIFQHKSAPDIIEAILRKHDFLGHQFQMKLRRTYPVHAFRMQHRMSDWDYIRLLMEKEGIFSYMTQGDHGDVVVFSDDIDGYLYAPQRTIPYRETAGLESTGVEAVFGVQTHAQTVQKSFLVADYNPANAWERVKGDANIAYSDTTTYGQGYVWGAHALTWVEAKWEAQLRHEAAIAWQIIYEGLSNVMEFRPARILRMDQTLPDAPNGQVIIEVVHSGARDKAYTNTYKAIPSDRRFRLQLNESAWPKIAGTVSARITAPDNYKYARLTEDGHYTVRFDFDFDESWPKGGESVPLRLAKSFAGGSRTGLHCPLLKDTEVTILFVNGDPNRPEIAAAHHHSIDPDLITSQDGWYTRNVLRTHSDNKLEMEDLSGQEHVKLSTEHSGKSQLTLGHMVHGRATNGRREKRGEGFELRTSAKGVLRAGQSMALLVHDQPGANGKQDDIAPAMKLLGSALEQMQALSNAVQRAQAELSDLRRQSELKDEKIKDLQQAVLLLSAPDGIAAVTGGSIQQSAGETLTLTAGKNIDLGASENLTVAVSEAISLFAHHNGMKLFAAEGTLQAQAQTGQMELSAKQDVTITSTDGQVQIAAAKSLLLTCQGAYIKLEGGEVEIGCPGNLRVRAADFDFQQPASKSLAAKLPPACASRQGEAASGGAGVVAR